MQAHFRSCTVPENNSRLWWMLAVRAAQIQEAFCASDFGSHCWERLRCFCNSCRSICNSCRCFCKSCPRVLGILSTVPSRCSRVALAASLGASSNVQERWRQAFVVMLGFFSTSAQACRTQCAKRRFMVLRRRSSTVSFRHTDSAKNCMACCLMLCFRGCWIAMSAGCSSAV